MGAVCGKDKSAAEPKVRKAAVEVSDGPPDPNAPQPPPIAASAVCPPKKPGDDQSEKVQEFITGEGEGVYLMLVAENNSTSLVQQYARFKPKVAEGDALLLQIKPPVYVTIKESRFVVQNGKRTLKMAIPVAMETPDGQRKVCEAVLECLRLTCAYSAYIHAYCSLDHAPFSVLLVVLERHEPAHIKDSSSGFKFVTEADDENGHARTDAEGAAETSVTQKEEENEKGMSAEEKRATEGGGVDLAAATEGKNPKDAEQPTIFQDAPQTVTETATPAVLEQVQVLRHLKEGRSPNFSLLRFILVIPLAKCQAEEVLKDGRIVEEGDIDSLQKQVEKLSKAD